MSAALKLEIFAGPEPHPSVPAGIPPAEHERALARARSEAHAQGYEQGAAEALARSEAELAMLLSGISEQLQDLMLSATEARSKAERAALALMRAVLEGVGPALARQGLGAEVTERLGTILAQGPAPELRLAAAPDMVERLGAVIEARGLSLPGLKLEADPALGGFSARLYWAGGWDVFDTGAAVRAASGVLERYGAALDEASAPRRAAG